MAKGFIGRTARRRSDPEKGAYKHGPVFAFLLAIAAIVVVALYLLYWRERLGDRLLSSPQELSISLISIKDQEVNARGVRRLSCTFEFLLTNLTDQNVTIGPFSVRVARAVLSNDTPAVDIDPGTQTSFVIQAPFGRQCSEFKMKPWLEPAECWMGDDKFPCLELVRQASRGGQ